MKKMFIPIFLIFSLILTVAAFGFIWYTTNQFTVAWDGVAINIEGEPIPAAEVQYEVFLANAITDPDKLDPVLVWTGAEIQTTLTLNTEGKYWPGVRAIRVIDGEKTAESGMAWSDNSTVCKDGVTFGVRYYLPLSNPSGLRHQ